MFGRRPWRPRCAVLVLVLAAVASVPALSAENDHRKESAGGPVDSHVPDLVAGYLGDFIFSHPGLIIGIEYPVLRRNAYQLIAASRLGSYIHRKNHVALLLDLQLGQRLSTSFGYFADVFVGVGYMHTWPQGPVYTGVDDAGQAIEKWNLGTPHLLFDLDITLLGWDFTKLTDLPLRLMIRAGIMVEYPYNGNILPHLNGQVLFAYIIRPREGTR